MSARLTVTAGANCGESFLIASHGMLLVGRGDGCDIQLHDPSVSRAHCRVGFRDSDVCVIDAGSSSGTWVNGDRIAEHPLQPGDRIAVGDTRLLFDVMALSSQATLPPANSTDDTRPSTAQTVMTSAVPPMVDAQPQAESPSPAGPVFTPKPSSDRDLAALVGKAFEGYKLTDVVSRTASGIVFRGLETGNGRDVAIKVLWPDLLRHEDDVRRFVRAVKTMKPIRHENLVTLYAGGYSHDGYCWCAMEWVDGETVHQAIDRIGVAGMLDWTYAIHVAHGVAKALELTYEHRIVHRNILPRNIFVRAVDRKVKLGDLVLAKALDESQAEKITSNGEIIGELGFLAPEQLSNTARKDCRSDIYNLGATVYAILTGRPPFHDDSPLTTINQIHKSRPENPTKYQLSIPPLFEGVVLQMLAKRPDDRYDTPSKLVRELERVARFQGVENL